MSKLIEDDIYCYIALQLICTVRFNGKFHHGPCDKIRYSKMLSLYTDAEKRMIIGKYECQFSREYSLLQLWELINQYARLIPKEYRYQAWDRCKLIMNSRNPLHLLERKILDKIEANLGITQII